MVPTSSNPVSGPDGRKHGWSIGNRATSQGYSDFRGAHWNKLLARGVFANTIPARRVRITMRMGALSATLLVFLATVGCVRRDGRNSDCKWPTEIASHGADARHLSADAEF